MTPLISIGDFSRMTHITVKALRHYHDVGVLTPAHVDAVTGYRYYDGSQLAAAHVIRRLRDLGMPLDDLKGVLEASDPDSRNRAIVEHLRRMEVQLEATQATVASLRAILDRSSAASIAVEFRNVPPVAALAVRDRVEASALTNWWTECFTELHAALAVANVARAGPDAALYSADFFETGDGEVTAYVPVTAPAAPRGRVAALEIPGGDFAVTAHAGSLDDLDQSYGALGAFVAERAIGLQGPIREIYLVTPFDTEDESRLRTEVGWPVFHTG